MLGIRRRRSHRSRDFQREKLRRKWTFYGLAVGIMVVILSFAWMDYG